MIEVIRSAVKGVNLDGTVPAVCISGGIDSAVVLYHVINDLMGGVGSDVWTFTVTFGNDQDEREKARRVAEHYGTSHKEVLVTRTDVMGMMRFILQYYPFPRYNLWPWMLVNEVRSWNLSHLFTGEGADELFGYPDRSFLEGWAGQLVWVQPAWKIPCAYFNIKLHVPFMEMQGDSLPVLKYYTPPDKEILRYAYKDILPDFILSQVSVPPSSGFYKMMGMTKEELQVEATRAWLDSRDEVHNRTYERLQS